MSNDVRVTFRLPSETLAEAHRNASRLHGVPMSEYVRIALVNQLRADALADEEQAEKLSYFLAEKLSYFF
jgi:hypothetical protein